MVIWLLKRKLKLSSTYVVNYLFSFFLVIYLSRLQNFPRQRCFQNGLIKVCCFPLFTNIITVSTCFCLSAVETFNHSSLRLNYSVICSRLGSACRLICLSQRQVPWRSPLQLAHPRPKRLNFGKREKFGWYLSTWGSSHASYFPLLPLMQPRKTSKSGCWGTKRSFYHIDKALLIISYNRLQSGKYLSILEYVWFSFPCSFCTAEQHC